MAEVSETFKWVIASLQNPTKKFHWFSAHDTNQVAILQALILPSERKKLGMNTIPPFGSDL
jgi:hypothetical protein